MPPAVGIAAEQRVAVGIQAEQVTGLKLQKNCCAARSDSLSEKRREGNGRYSRERGRGTNCRCGGNYYFGRCEMSLSKTLAAS